MQSKQLYPRPTQFCVLLVFLAGQTVGGASLLSQEPTTETRVVDGEQANQDPSISPLTDADYESWWRAAQQGDVAELERLLAAGMPVDARTRYDATALMFASGRGHVPAVKLLLAAGAEPNTKDRFYSASPMSWAAMKSNLPVALLLAEAGSNETYTAMTMAVRADDAKALQQLIELAEPREQALRQLKSMLPEDASGDLLELFADVADPAPRSGPDARPWQPTPRQLEAYAGNYVAAFDGDATTEDLPVQEQVTVSVREDQLLLTTDEEVQLLPTAENSFRFGQAELVFQVADDLTTGFELSVNATTLRYDRVAPAAEPSRYIPSKADLAASSANWPQFRGQAARGVADGQNPPLHWNVPEGLNVLWKRELPGLAHSCPIVLGERLYVTTAVSQGEDQGLRNGLYGDVDSVEDNSMHSFEVHCLDKRTGDTLWKQVACEAVPVVKRHLKGTHANPTPATDGEYVVAFFGGQGLYCYDVDGKLQWQHDLGVLDSGWFFDASYQWGFAASPIIFRDTVIVQCDVQGQSFLAAFRLRDGEEVWRTPREEIPSWSTPTVVATSHGLQLVTNATNYARAYDPETGQELWRVGKHSEIVVPTPFAAHDLIYIASGYRPIKRILAIQPHASGDLSDELQAEEFASIAWSADKAGPYMVTPICYGDYFYTCDSRGVFQCLDARTGARIYRKRISSSEATSFVGSLVAGDGHVYVPSEEGIVLVIKAGPQFEIVAENPLGELMLSTPAISEGVLYLRGQKHLVAVQQQDSL